jgi:hypothetical protein
MTSPRNDAGPPERLSSGVARWRRVPVRLTAATSLALVIVLLAAACGGSTSHGSARSSATSKALAQALAYIRCMRSHGLPGIPDPTTKTVGEHVTINVNVGAGSNLNPDDPIFQTATRACRSLLPAGKTHAVTVSSQQLAHEVKWASCLRAHGLPSFPDPNGQGAFNYVQLQRYVSLFDAKSPLVVDAAKACKAYQPKGSISAVP